MALEDYLQNRMNPAVRQASTLPVNQVPSIEQQLNQAAQRGIEKNRINQAQRSVNPEVEPLGVQNFKRWAGRGMNALGGIPQAIGASQLYQNVKQMGPLGGYANWLGAQTYNPQTDYQ